MHPALVILSFLCACALFALVPIHRARISLPIGALVFWLIAANVVHGVDAILWVTPSTPKLFAWCDVSIRLSMAATLAIPTSSLCILHRLSFQALPRSTSRPFITARCIILFDLTLCLVCPLLYVAFYSLVQQHRFIIVEDIGCLPSVSATYPTLFVMLGVPLVLSLCIMVFSVMTGIAFARQQDTLPRSVPAEDASARPFFVRMLIGTSMEGLLIVIVSVIALFAMISSTLMPFGTMPDFSARTSSILTVTLSELSVSDRIFFQVFWWTIPTSSLILAVSLAPNNPALYHMRTVRSPPRKLRLFDSSQAVSSVHSDQSCSEVLDITLVAAPDPVHIPTSGWQDRSEHAHRKPVLHPIRTDTLDPRPPSPSPVVRSAESETAFSASTLTYIGSPTGRRALACDTCIPTPEVTPPTPVAATTPALGPRRESDRSSMTSAIAESLLAASAWPRPPSTIPSPEHGLAPFSHYHHLQLPQASWTTRPRERDVALRSGPRALLTHNSMTRRQDGGSQDGISLMVVKEVV